MRSFVTSSLLLSVAAAAVIRDPENHGHRNNKKFNVQVGPRPYYLVDNMDEGPLKKKLQSCSEGPFKVSDFNFAHRGAPLQFPEHTLESYKAARRMGAGVIECDVAFTNDRKLVCRHDQCDLHTTTNVLSHPELAAKCSTPFEPATDGKPANVKCCTYDFTLAEFKTLCGKMDGFNPNATTVEEYQDGTAAWRTDLYSNQCPTLMSHDEYIKLVKGWGLKMTPELKTPAKGVMPFNGYTQAQFAQDLIDAYKRAGVSSKQVWPQSFLPDDVFYWIDNEPAFGRQAVYLDERVDTVQGYLNATASIPELKRRGVKILAPAFFALTKLDENKKIVPSEYAIAAKKAGMKLVGWSFERSGRITEETIEDGTYYYELVKDVMNNDGDIYKVLDVLAREVGIMAMFTDWPATVTYYASCFGL
ncbi:PLC-like phosphodiesterase [Sporormia fimetaria CBS 119925]|uniref:glycerophosphodiester phosphodiesterase n=1 Tax=Sporormia fimetaria CBS 119925 TaxID=1340428 RepID=A0A6A6V6Z4_9PLEO|nr:PLC-like phosphodiesterase [Sporormia fimetaria CBS 119925]